jgi:hypothetical protein
VDVIEPFTMTAPDWMFVAPVLLFSPRRSNFPSPVFVSVPAPVITLSTTSGGSP